ncbi:MAG: DUF192 domain-containing protein [Candidatus Sericytochromatia bacterium]
MKIITIRNKENNTLISDNIGLANTMLTRFIGLMNKKTLEDNEGILLTPCNSIHMMFMKFPLDIVFLDRKNKVIKIIENLKPWRVSPVIFMAQSVLELPSGTISKTGLKINDTLDF